MVFGVAVLWAIPCLTAIADDASEHRPPPRHDGLLEPNMSDPDLSEELQRALNEQTSAIESFEIVVAPFEHAEITLLEKNCIRVQVTKEGWQVTIMEQSS